jgi:hypothetical protein
LAAERGREGRGTTGRGGDCAAAPGELGSEERKKKGKGKGRLTGGAQVSASRRKKEKGEERWAGADDGRRAVWAERGAGEVFFFSFSFSNFIFKQFLFIFKSNFFKLFLKNFIKFFRNHTSNQKPCKPTDDAQTLVVSKFIKLRLIF